MRSRAPIAGLLMTMAFALAIPPSHARYFPPYLPEWREQVGTQEFDYVVGVASTPDGGAVVGGATLGDMAGEHEGSESEQNAVVLKYDDAGQIQWGDQFGGAGGRVARAVDVSSTGDIYVTGTGDAGGGSMGWLRKYSPIGVLLWEIPLGSDPVLDMSPYGIDERDGFVYVAGPDTPSPTDGTWMEESGSVVAKFDSTGGFEWADAIRNENHTVTAFGISATSDGGAAVVGMKGLADVGEQTDGFVRLYDAEGEMEWNRAVGGPDYDRMSDAEVTNSGIYVTGSQNSCCPPSSINTGDAVVKRLDASGNIEWSRPIPGMAYSSGIALTSSPSGRVFMAGQGWAGPGPELFAAELREGGVAWKYKLGGTNGPDQIGDLDFAPNGRIYVVGLTDGLMGTRHFGGIDGWLIKLARQHLRRLSVAVEDHKRLTIKIRVPGGSHLCSGADIRIRRKATDESPSRTIEREVEAELDGTTQLSVPIGDRSFVRYLVTASAERLPNGESCANSQMEILHKH
jgi:hypothetical protein